MSILSIESAEYLTVAETANRLRCGRRAVYDLIAAGHLRAVRIGTGPRARLRIPAAALQELELQRTAGRPEVNRAVDASAAGDAAPSVGAPGGRRAPTYREEETP